MDMNIDINSPISEGSAGNVQCSLQEFLGSGEYEVLLSQVKALFTEFISDKNFNVSNDKKDFKEELFFGDARESGKNNDSEIFLDKILVSEKDAELFLQSMIEKTADALQSFYKQKHRNVQAQGIAAAKARGVRCGRPEKELPENFGLIAKEQACGRISMRTAAGLCGMSVSTFARRKKKLAETETPMTGLQENKSSKKSEAK